MALQKVFKPDYIQYLKQNIKVENYTADRFVYDESQVRQLANVPHDPDLINKLDPTPKGDLQSAIAIYEAFPNLSRVFAQQDELWVYLTHVDLFDYVKKRWPIEKAEEDPINHIEHHWFRDKFQFQRTTFAGFWWSVKLTIDEHRDDKYELTRYLYKNTEFRTSSFGELPLIRYENSMKGILEFVKDHEELFKTGFSAKARYIRHLFNIVGGYKTLATLPQQFFYDCLEKHVLQIEKAQKAEEVKAGADIYNE